MIRLWRSIRAWIRKRLFVKIMLITTVTTAVVLIILGSIAGALMENTAFAQETDYQNQAINAMSRYIQDMELEFARLLYSVDDTRYTDILRYLRDEQKLDAYAERVQILRHLSAMLGASEDILDVILIRGTDDQVMSRSRSRWILSDAIAASDELERIRQNGDTLTVLPTYRPLYVRNSEDNIITYAVNLMAPSPVRERAVGTLIVNYKAENLKKAISAFSHLKGNLLVTDRAGHVVFDDAGLLAGQGFSQFDEMKSGTVRGDIGGAANLITYDKGSLNNYHLICATPIAAVLMDYRAVRGLFALVIGLLVLVSAAVMIVSGKAFSRKLSRVNGAMAAFEAGDFAHRIAVAGEDELDTLALDFNRMSERLEQYIERVYVLELKQKSAELAALQAQINPHYLYNVLETIRMEAVERGEETIADMVFALGRLFRMTLKNPSAIIAVEQEIEYLGYYLQLQKYRLSERLRYTIDIDPALKKCGIPKFSLQPLVENAIQHGIDPVEHGGAIEITGAIEAGRAVFRVADNGAGIAPAQLKALRERLARHDAHPSGGIGLMNVNDRVKLLFGAEYGLTLTCAAGRTVGEMIIPLIDGGGNVQSLDRG